jgi:hypothetical protein
VNPTTVISVRGINSREARAALTSDPTFVYCGRQFAGWPASIYGNPYKGPGAVERYREALLSAVHRVSRPGYVLPDGPRMAHPMDHAAASLPELAGCRLACWCGTWAPGDPPLACHAWVIAEVVNAMQGG